MKLDLKILCVILAVILAVGFLDAEPASRRRASSSRRRASFDSRRRVSFVSRRRRSSSSGSSSKSSSPKVATILVVPVLILVFIIVFFIYLYCKRRSHSDNQELQQEFQMPVNKGYHHREDTPKMDEEPFQENTPANNTEFSDTDVHATASLPYPPGEVNDGYVYPDDKSSPAYPPQGAAYPNIDGTNFSAYPPQFTSSACPTQGTEGAQEGTFAPYPPPLQFDSGQDMPPPPSYDDIEAKKEL